MDCLWSWQSTHINVGRDVDDQRIPIRQIIVSGMLLFGGTFDPVHNGHVAMLECAVANLHPASVKILPVGNPWQKGRLPFAAAPDRVAMLKLAMPHVDVDERELTRSGPTYTVDTLREISREHPSAKLYWLIGSDSFTGLDSWHEASKLATLATFVVVRRANEILVPPTGKFCYQALDCSPPPVSSTAIRANWARGESIVGLVPDGICDYIQQHQLYDAR